MKLKLSMLHDIGRYMLGFDLVNILSGNAPAFMSMVISKPNNKNSQFTQL